MMSNKNTILTAIFLLSAMVSVFSIAQRTLKQLSSPSSFKLHQLSEQFIGLKKTFVNVPRAGYFSDKNMDIPLAIAQFEQAQYVLAPTVLELNNTSLPYVIIDCTTPEIALAKIKELKLIPLSASNTGIVLAANPQGIAP